MTKDDVLKFNELIMPTLQAMQELGGSANVDEINSKVIEMLQLPDEMCNLYKNDTASTPLIEERLNWARVYLKKCNLITNSKRAVWSFTEQFNGDTNSIDVENIVLIGKSINSRSQERDDEESWQAELRDSLLAMKPDAFERLTMRILRESGFSQVEVTGRSNDRGIDGKGIIRLNGMMSFHMLFQCKRYKGSVSSSEIRDFRGAMQGRADKGLFITTGSFTKEAHREATRDGAPAIDLIDGDALVEKLRELELGVTEKVITYYEVNHEWFSAI